MNNVMSKYATSRDLKQCAICSRRFTTDRLKTHETICQKSASETRKLFDVSQQRIGGTEFEKVKNNIAKDSGIESTVKVKGPSALSTNWRRRHDELMTSIKQSKLGESEKKNCRNLNDLPLSPVLNCNDYVRCPHCLRNFNPPAAARHIVQCQKFIRNELNSKESLTAQTELSDSNIQDK